MKKKRTTTVWKAALMKAVFTLAACILGMQTAWADADSGSSSTLSAPDSWSVTKSEPDHYFDGGDGTQNSPYLISSAQALADLAWFVNDGNKFEGKYFKMTKDLKLNSFTFANDTIASTTGQVQEWVPIGKYGSWKNKYFEGIFDGNGHKIEGLLVNVTTYDYGGLFGCIDDAIIRNLTIDQSFLFAEHRNMRKGVCAYGMLVGYLSDSQLYECHVKNSVINGTKYKFDRATSFQSDQENFGGLVGQGSGDMTLRYCSFSKNTIKIAYYGGTLSVAGMMADGDATYNKCKVDNTAIKCKFMKYNESDFWSDSSNEACFSGFCYEAKDITDCPCNVSFDMDDPGQKDEKWKKWTQRLRVNSFCYEAKNMSRCSSFSSVVYKNYVYSITEGSPSNKTGISNVSYAESITDCAFYTKADFSQLKLIDYEKGYYCFKFYPLGLDKKNSISKVNRVVVLDDENSLIKPTGEPDLIKKVDNYMPSSETLYRGGISELENNYYLGRLNNPTALTTVWGLVGGDGEYKNCPLPASCGGTTTLFKGKGTAESPYLIGSEQDLHFLAKYINGNIKSDEQNPYFMLSADIDMSGSEAIEAIGNSTSHPFSGTFDGNGHVISNITYKGAALFGYMFGTVKNLAIVGIKGGGEVDKSNSACFGGIVNDLGYSTPKNTGKIENCYVGGDVSVNLPTMSGTSSTPNVAYVGGLCSYLNEGTIKNSYFKGHITLNNESDYPEYVGGITGGYYCYYATLQDSYASYRVSGTGKGLTIHGIAGKKGGNGTNPPSNCYAVCDQITKASGSYNSQLDGIVCASDKEILDKFTYTDGSAWLKGAYRPILSSTRHYDVTTAEGSATKTYYDAIPMVDEKSANNDIYHYTLNQGDETDLLLWSLPNLAIYNSAEQSDYILNCTLVPSQPLGYTKKGDVQAVKVNMHYPLALTSDKNYYMLCLPGSVTHSALPKGSKIFIPGTVVSDQGHKYLNVIQADSVPAGVPFIAWIPTAFTQKKNSLDIVMRSKMAVEPAKTIDYGDGKTLELELTGTYKEAKLSDVCAEVKKNTEDNCDYLIANSEEQTVNPFSSYLKSESDVKLLDCLLLSETADELDKVLEMYENDNMDILLERTLRKDKWNTICLPFSMTADEIQATFGQKTKIDKFSKISVLLDGECELRFVSKDDGIEAGKCYLIKPTQDISVAKLLKRTLSKELNNDECTVALKDASLATIALRGTFSSRILGNEKYTGTDNADEYFLQDNKIYHVTKGHNIVINGFRFYLTANEAAAQALSRAIVVHGDGSTTALRMIEVGAQADSQRIYDLQGIEHDANHLQRGVYIKGSHKYVK